jgi:hypothetical protein
VAGPHYKKQISQPTNKTKCKIPDYIRISDKQQFLVECFGRGKMYWLCGCGKSLLSILELLLQTLRIFSKQSQDLLGDDGKCSKNCCVCYEFIQNH